MRAYSEKQGEPFHQNIMSCKKFCQAQYNKHMMSDFMWGLLRWSCHEYNGKSKSVHLKVGSKTELISYFCLFLFLIIA